MSIALAKSNNELNHKSAFHLSRRGEKVGVTPPFAGKGTSTLAYGISDAFEIHPNHKVGEPQTKYCYLRRFFQ